MVDYLRKTKVMVPKEAKTYFPYNDSLRFGISYGKGSPPRIYVYLVPKNGNGFLEKIICITPEVKSMGLADEARKIARDEAMLTKLLLGYAQHR